MKVHLAIAAHVDVNAPALALRGLCVFPRREVFGRRHDHRVGPARLEIALAVFLDGGNLRAPEGIGVDKIAVLAEQVGDDPAHPFGAEQGMFDRDRLIANSHACNWCPLGTQASASS
ncbi:hypothetical protein [Novosphingobium sp. PP1Y]|uniref:hypothetical protein n=1 Tax=Novosphingobium sp. PP1Y TaxID=702113 RepID=UPI000686743F|nr:hypothetical protein [Novosphingobium sp. PP1Y]